VLVCIFSYGRSSEYDDNFSILPFQNMDKFNDITEGGNSGCDGEEGFPAAKGWDPVTGVGTPNYEKLAQAVLALP